MGQVAVRSQLKLDIKICLVKNGYPPQYSPEVFTKVMDQVENFGENAARSDLDVFKKSTYSQYHGDDDFGISVAAEKPICYEAKKPRKDE